MSQYIDSVNFFFSFSLNNNLLKIPSIQRRDEKIPIRWSPPEVFNKREYRWFFTFIIHQIRKKSADRLMLFSGTLYRDCMQRWQCRIHNGTPNPLTDVFSLIYTNILCLQVLIFKLINIHFLELAGNVYSFRILRNHF